jgi:molecular chaperone GrpE
VSDGDSSENTKGNVENGSGQETQVSSDELAKAKNDYLYLRAEFENFKRNAIKERSDLLKYGSERLWVDLLNVLDNFERATAAKVSAENLENYVKGVEMTYQDFKNVLSKFGVTEIPAQGAAFDPSLHEALSSEETDEVPPGHISKVFKKPYKLHERVIRPGQVVVAKEMTKN